MKPYLIILIMIISSCNSAKNIQERQVELVAKNKVIKDMAYSYQLVFSDGSKRIVNNTDAHLYVVGRCYLIR